MNGTLLMEPMPTVADWLAPLAAAARGSPHLRYFQSPPFFRDGRAHRLPHMVFNGPPAAGEVIRLGLFAGIHGDEPEGVRALIELARRLLAEPARAAGYQLHLYPACNPTGLATGTRLSDQGLDLNREFWKGSAEPEVWWLEHELIVRRFDGVISLHSDNTANGCYAYVSGAVFTENLARPALAAAARVLPVDTRPMIDGFPNRGGLLHECFPGVLASPPVGLDPPPFELIVETPQSASGAVQVQASLAAIFSVLETYSGFLAYQTGL